MNTALFIELMEDKQFVIEMLSQSTAKDVQMLFAAKGLELTMDEVNCIGRELAKLEDSEEELSDDNLELVSGGFAVATAWALAKAVIAVGAAGVAVYKWYKSR